MLHVLLVGPVNGVHADGILQTHGEVGANGLTHDGGAGDGELHLFSDAEIFGWNRPEPRRAYWTKDLKRWAALRGKRLSFDNRAALSDPTPAGALVAAAIDAGEDWFTLTLALQEAFWGRGEDIGNSTIRRAIVDRAGFDGGTLDERGHSAAIEAQLKASYETAKAAGVFGVPTVLVGGEVVWGDDAIAERLERFEDDLARWDGLGEQVPAEGYAVLFGRSIAAAPCQVRPPGPIIWSDSR